MDLTKQKLVTYISNQDESSLKEYLQELINTFHKIDQVIPIEIDKTTSQGVEKMEIKKAIIITSFNRTKF